MKTAAEPKFSFQFIRPKLACRILSAFFCPRSTLAIPNANGSLYPSCEVTSATNDLNASVDATVSIAIDTPENNRYD